MTENFFVARLFQMCQEGKIDWIPSSEGGFVSQVNGIDVRIVGGGECSWIFLSIYSGFKQWSIREPMPYLSDAPAGKMINWVRKNLGLPPMKGPQKDSDKENSEIRANLIAIRNFADNQVMERYKQSNGYDKERQKLFQQLIYGELIIARGV